MFKKKPYFIAEISANHAGSLDRALKLILEAKKSGADAVKIQTYTADTMTIKSSNRFFKIKDGLWKNQNLWKLYNEAKTPLDWHKTLFRFAKKIGIKIFSTPFDESAVDFLEKLKCPMYKVASFEMNYIQLIKKIAKTKKPLIISTGMADLNEIDLAYKTAKRFGAKNISLLYCVSNYPSKPKDFNMNNIRILKNKFKCSIGFSDHSNDNKIAMAACAAGAEIFEKHIALKNQCVGHDIKFSSKGDQIKNYIDEINFTYNLFKKNEFIRSKSEKKIKIYRRSIFAKLDIFKGDKFNKDNIKIVRPGHGLNPIYYENLIGRKSPFKINKAHPLKKNILKKLKIKI